MDDMELWWFLLMSITCSCFSFLVVLLTLRKCYPDLFATCYGAVEKQTIPVAEVVDV